MIQSIIAALVSLFIWSKSTKDVEEKTEHSFRKAYTIEKTKSKK